MRKVILCLLVLFAVVVFAVPARAGLITIGLQQTGVNGGAITIETSGTGSASIPATTAYGTFTSVQVSSTGLPIFTLPSLLDSNSINVSSSTPNVPLKVWVTEQGITAPIGPGVNFTNSFTTNALPAGWTVVESTYFDQGNGLFTTGTPMDTYTFSAIGTNVQYASFSNVTSPYSVTHLFTITAAGTLTGNSNSTIDTSAVAVPEPGSMLLLGSGLFGLGAAIRRRVKK